MHIFKDSENTIFAKVTENRKDQMESYDRPLSVKN